MYDKQPEEVYSIFEKLSQNSRHKNSRRKKGIYTVDASTETSIQIAQLVKKMDNLTTDLGQMKSWQQKVFIGERQVGGPGLEEEKEGQAMNNYNSRPRNDPYSNTYNPGWRNHPNYSWSNNNQTSGNQWGNNTQGTGNQWGNNNGNQRQFNAGA